MPSFSANQLAAIESRAYYACDLIEMDFTAAISAELGLGGNPLFLCTANADLTLTTDTGTHTYIGGKNGILDTPSVSQAADSSKTTVDITLSALNLLYVATVQGGDFMNTGIRLYKCIFSSDTSDSNTGLTIIDSPVQMFKGFIKGAQYNAGANDNQVTFNCHHFLFDNTTTNNLSTNVENFKTWEKNSWANTYANINPNLTNDNRLPFTNQETSAYEVRWGQK